MVRIDLKYQGDLRVEARHGPSGTQLVTDAPVDNQGKGESFSPTDLVATGLGSCMATVMGILAKKRNIDLQGMEIQVVKKMSQDPPRRIVGLEVDIHIPHEVVGEDRKELERVALTCPVAQSIHPMVEVLTRFTWGK